MIELGTFKWWPKLQRLLVNIDGIGESEKHVQKSLKASLAVLEKSGSLRHLHLMNIDIPNKISLPVAQRCKKLQSWSSLNYHLSFDKLKPVIKAQRNSLEMLELAIGSSNSKMLTVISKCPKLKTLILHAERASKFSLCGLSLLSNLTTLEIDMPFDTNFRIQDFPGQDSLPNMKTVKICTTDTTNRDFSFIYSLATACENLQSFTILSPNKVYEDDRIESIIRNCPNIEIFKLKTKDAIIGSNQKPFKNLSTHCPEIKYLQWKGGHVFNQKALMQTTPSLIAIDGSTKLSVSSKTKFEDIADILKLFELTIPEMFGQIVFF